MKGIEAYLMGKWIGRLPEGYVDIRQSTVMGTGKVTGALDCPEATLSLPASCSITVNFTRRLPNRMPSCDYTLVDCASGADGVDWTFISGANTTSRCRFLKTGNKVIFRYVRPGTTIVFR